MITYTLVMLVLVNGVRASYRMFYQLNRESNADGEPVVIYGAGRGGALALREILTNTAVPMKPIGFIDDNPLMKGRFINGYPVLGNLDDLADVVLNGKARGLVIASEKIPITKLRNAQAVCESRGAWMRVFTIDFRIVSGDDQTPAYPEGGGSDLMKCPACSSSRVYHSRAMSFRDRVLKRALPITFYRCHDCGWRRFRMVQGWKGFGVRVLAHWVRRDGVGAGRRV